MKVSDLSKRPSLQRDLTAISGAKISELPGFYRTHVPLQAVLTNHLLSLGFI